MTDYIFPKAYKSVQKRCVQLHICPQLLFLECHSSVGLILLQLMCANLFVLALNVYCYYLCPLLLSFKDEISVFPYSHEFCYPVFLNSEVGAGKMKNEDFKEHTPCFHSDFMSLVVCSVWYINPTSKHLNFHSLANQQTSIQEQ